MLFLLAISTGVFSVAFWPQLPDQYGYSLLVLLVSAIYRLCLRFNMMPVGWVKCACLIVICFAWGSCWGLLSGHDRLRQLLPDNLEKKQLLVTGTIVSLVETDDRRSRFSLAVDSARLLNDSAQQAEGEAISLELLQLSWYQNQRTSARAQSGVEQLRAGDHWQFVVRLRRPRGMLNQGVFDYQSWLVRRGYSATGSIRAHHQNQLIEPVQHGVWCHFRDGIARWRSRIESAISSRQLSAQGSAVIKALTIGDKQQISQWWEMLARLGVVHLLVISGLHIGLMAAMGFMLGGMVSRLLLLWHSLLPSALDTSASARWLPPIMGLLVALCYSLIAGFSLPTQRALIAVAVVVVAKLYYRRVRPYVCLVWALLLIAISQPLAVLSAGFWLSFTAVTLLLWWFSPWQLYASRRRISRTLSAQLMLAVGLLVPTLLFMGRASWLAPAVNLIAVPWVSFVSVPLSLIGAMLVALLPHMADGLWQAADWSISILWTLLQQLPNDLGFFTSSLAMGPWVLASVALAALGALLPRGLPGRWLCLLPVTMAWIATSEDKPLRLTVLDVGQGLAVVVETQRRVLVYDSGPSFSAGFNAGASIVAPFLRQRGRSRIDKLIISHEDADHAGGFRGLLESMDIQQLILAPGFIHRYQSVLQTATKPSICGRPLSWIWPYYAAKGQPPEAIRFEILAPNLALPAHKNFTGNNNSCVLRIQWRDQLILLPGDIEKAAERQLLADGRLSPLTVLIAPHHGSKTSSSMAFIARLKPEHVVFSAGYRHHFGHPHSNIVRRYQTIGSKIWRTAEQGGLSFVWDSYGALTVQQARSEVPSYWWR